MKEMTEIRKLKNAPRYFGANITDENSIPSSGFAKKHCFASRLFITASSSAIKIIILQIIIH